MNRRKFLLAGGASLAVPALNAIPRANASQSAAGGNHLKTPHRPNVVVIICDDLGYGDLGCYGSKLSTPNLDRLAANGVLLRSHVTPTPVCSASRAALLTGLYPTRINTPRVFFPPTTDGMTLGTETLANVLHGAGYRSMAIGKWHLGHTKPYLPLSRGFDEYFGVPYSVDMQPLPLIQDMKIVAREADRSQLTQQYTKQAVEFIDRAKDKPFFLYMAHSYPHIPLFASKEFRGKSPLGLYGDVVHEIDWSVGKVVDAIRHNGLEENTLVIFTSDHGPWFQGSTGNLRGRKGTTCEGGVRIPMVASLPGVLPANQTRDALSSHLDMLPTIAHLCGAGMPERPVDGNDMWKMLSGQEQEVERDHAILHFSEWNLQCARWQQWKLHVARPNVPQYLPRPAEGKVVYRLRHPELYHVIDDPKESYDVAAKYPEIVARIQQSIQAQLATMPDRVKEAHSATMQHVTNPWMPAGSYAESSDDLKPISAAANAQAWATFKDLGS
ncbi:MAG: sulfatase [Acidobacteriaceae bacterium]